MGYPIIWQFNIGKLKLINRGYGIDYYWGERYLLTSAPMYILVNIRTDENNTQWILIIDVACGIQYHGKMLWKTPKWWQRLFYPPIPLDKIDWTSPYWPSEEL